jgi:hypothetical protein
MIVRLIRQHQTISYFWMCLNSLVLSEASADYPPTHYDLFTMRYISGMAQVRKLLARRYRLHCRCLRWKATSTWITSRRLRISVGLAFHST